MRKVLGNEAIDRTVVGMPRDRSGAGAQPLSMPAPSASTGNDSIAVEGILTSALHAAQAAPGAR